MDFYISEIQGDYFVQCWDISHLCNTLTETNVYLGDKGLFELGDIFTRNVNIVWFHVVKSFLLLGEKYTKKGGLHYLSFGGDQLRSDLYIGVLLFIR